MVHARSDIQIRNDLRPGDLGGIVKLHGDLYAAEHGLDHTFETYVAAPLAAFVRRAAPLERIWIVDRGHQVLGSVAVVAAAPAEAQLRWLLVHPDLRGRGLGRHLVAEALAFGHRSGYRRIFLWTLAHLTAAIGIYRRFGFQRVEEKAHRLWGRNLVEEKFTLSLASTPPTEAPPDSPAGRRRM